MTVPFFRPSLGKAEIDEVVDCLRSGWLTTGPRVKTFETEFAAAVGAKHAVALNSCTAGLHLAVEALGLSAGQAVLVPTMTFAATAEVVRYQAGVPIFVDCDPVTLNMDLNDAEQKLRQLREGHLLGQVNWQVVGIMPVHVGGLMIESADVVEFAERHGLWIVEDAAHAFPAATRRSPGAPWRRCGEGTADVTCFSFYANKTITTGEGGMAVTEREDQANRIRQMSLHGLTHNAWNRYRGESKWDYRIVAPGYKYNLTDIAAAIGLHQLRQAEIFRLNRQAWAEFYIRQLFDVGELELPPNPKDRIHSWHLFPIRLRLERLTITRSDFFEALRERGVHCSVHWRPLHLHPYYAVNFGWTTKNLPAASEVWNRLISLPIFPGMTEDEANHVVTTVRDLCHRHRRRKSVSVSRRSHVP
jgi:perosamine synthetase